nr:agrin [Parasteatoda tepidariorum]
MNATEVWSSECGSYHNYPCSFGERGPCHNYLCYFGAICVVKGGYAICECPDCNEEYEPVCGTDGVSYTNVCKLKQAGCAQKSIIDVAYTGLCNGCESKKCEFYAICEINGNNEARCVCPHSCVKVIIRRFSFKCFCIQNKISQIESSVCGTDGMTYLNECEMRVSACNKRQYVVVGSKGPCDLCQNVHCKYGARCENGHCVCPVNCPDTYEAVCASNGLSYPNECKMRRAACISNRNLKAMFYGECEDISSSGQDMSTSTKGCVEKNCQFGATCQLDTKGLPQCVCNLNCPPIRKPICGSDNVIHDNDCALKEESCRQQTQIYILPMSLCEEYKEVPCDGERPLVNPVTGREYSCRTEDAFNYCPPSSYCHRTTSFAKCCREVVTIKTCIDTPHGCCPDGKTAAPGSNNAGCPSDCNCNKLGSYGLICDPESKQCSCKPGVGGMRCDRCEPGYWGLHMATEGNSGCSSCNCNQHGSVRDDCEQMTGRCVCKQGIMGMKCDICPAGTALGSDGCTDVSTSKPMSGSCSDVSCINGATCEEKNGIAQCLCNITCPTPEKKDAVCGSDGSTYASKCQLNEFSCKYQKQITVAFEGACKRGQLPHSSPTNSPVRRSTALRTAADYSETKTIRDITLGLSNMEQAPAKPTLATPIPLKNFVEIPSFFGRSYLELPRLQAYTRLSLELEFRTFSKDGILLYNGQTATGIGDFVSLSIKDAFVEFRYNLGNGAVVLRSPQKLHLGKFHRLIAKRYLREGMLALEGQQDVAGKSQGSLKSLDLGENLFLGYIPTERKEIFDNIAVHNGMVGCIRRLKIGKKEVDLRYPHSKDIIKGHGIHECGTISCIDQPCKNDAICVPISDTDFECLCLPGYSGSTCEILPSECINGNGPCSDGSNCVIHEEHGFVCKCPFGRYGDLCEKTTQDSGDIFVPDFKVDSYMEFPTLANVRQAFNIEVWFLTRSLHGTILYNGQHSSGKGDFISIVISEGYVLFRFDLGSSVQSVSSKEPVSLNEWHSVKINRLWKNGSLQVDGGDVLFAESSASLTELNLESNLFVGGVPNLQTVNHDSAVKVGLDGAIQRITVNGDIWDKLMSRALWSHRVHRYTGAPCDNSSQCLNDGICVPTLNVPVCKCPIHFWGQRCEKEISKEDLERPVAFDGHKFLSFSNKIVTEMEGQRETNIEITFRTGHESGLLIWTNKGATIRGDYLALAISKGHLQLSFNLGKQTQPFTITSTHRIDDLEWHTALIERNMRRGTMTIDDNAPISNTSEPGATELNTDGAYWIGGCSSLPIGLPEDYYKGFNGCIDSIILDGDPLHLMTHGTGDVTFCDEF